MQWVLQKVGYCGSSTNTYSSTRRMRSVSKWWRILLVSFWGDYFFFSFHQCFFFKAKHSVGPILCMNGWCDWPEIKRRCISWMLGQLYGHEFWPLPHGNEKGSNSVGYWVGHMTLPFDPWLWSWIFKGKHWNNIILGMGGPIDMGQRGCESIIHDHDRDLLVTIVGRVVDVTGSDRGDFRHRRAADMSSFMNVCENRFIFWRAIFRSILVAWKLYCDICLRIETRFVSVRLTWYIGAWWRIYASLVWTIIGSGNGLAGSAPTHYLSHS